MLKSMAERVARSQKGVGTEERVFIDPASIALYATIIMEIIKLAKKIKACRDAKKLQESAQSPGFLEKRVVKTVTRRKMGLKRYLKEGRSVVNSIFEVGAGSTEEEWEQLYNEVK